MFRSGHSPNIHSDNQLTKLMHQVMLATVPGFFALLYFFGWGVLFQLLIACTTALITETLMLKLRNRDWRMGIKDSSALVTAILLGLALPPLIPWWMTVLGVFFAIAFAKHLYGGLGYNPFNPAMVGYVLLLISFPVQMSSFSPALELWENALNFSDTFALIFTGATTSGITMEILISGVDGYSSATPLDTMKHQLAQGYMTSEVLKDPIYSGLAGVGWQWVNLGFLAGGIFLIYKRCTAWQLSAGMLIGLGGMALIFNVFAGDDYASPLFHLLSGGTMLGAFFIITDPVTASTTTKGRWIYAIGVGMLIWVIRTWGGYPDAIAFSILLMNMAAPTIDHYTRPLVYGEKDGGAQ